jgi:ribosomal protein S18 acetylase RimI-like enzyme
MTPPDNITIRSATPADHSAVSAVIPEWWGGRDLRASVPKLFFIHFSPTSFIAEQDGDLAGFLVGFLSQTFPEEAYIHFAGVRPDLRNQGLARGLYEEFIEVARSHGRRVIRSCTSPVNKLSIGFHRRIGFSIEPGNKTVDGIPVTTGYLQEKDDKVLFKLCI